MMWLIIAIVLSPFVWILSERIAKKIRASYGIDPSPIEPGEISPKPHSKK